MPTAEEDAEHRLAVLTTWGLFGPFALAVGASGFAADRYLVCLGAYGLLAAAFVAHVIVNWVYGRGFRNGEVAAAIGIYGVAVLVFMASWLLDPAFSTADVYAGLTGLVLAIGGFLGYLITRYGLRGSFSMFHIRHA
jgi:hypothetical protein